MPAGRYFIRPPRWQCRWREAFEDRFWPLNWLPRACSFVYEGEANDGRRGVYSCHCGAAMYGLRVPIVVRPGETVKINFGAWEEHDG